ncbi:MAG: glycosyltransferase [Patescibacteria group bacterium]|nr:glycosyltransferase [Patescibacteria group bacterium]
MSKEIYLSVIIPCKNEKERLGKNLDKYIDYLNKQEYSYEIIICDYGNETTEMTKKVAMERKKDCPNLKFIVLDESKKFNKEAKKGFQVQQAMQEAVGEVKMFLDADGATKINELDHALPRLKEGYDVVIGSRFLEESNIKEEVHRVWYREAISKLANLVIQILAVRGIKDTQCGFKIFTKEAANDIFSLLRIGGWAFDMEVLTIAKAHGFKIKEEPVEWNEVGGGNINIRAYIESLRDLFKIKWFKLTGKYSKKRLEKVKNAKEAL